MTVEAPLPGAAGPPPPPPWQPPPDPDLAPFWAAAREGRLDAPWCEACGQAVLYPRSLCPRCHGPTVWRTLSGRGTVYSYGIEQRDVAPGLGLVPPYVVALVELDEGGRFVTNVVDDPARVAIGAPVRVVFHDLGDGRVVPRFTLVDGAPA